MWLDDRERGQCEQGLGARSAGKGDDDPPDESILEAGGGHTCTRGGESTGLAGMRAPAGNRKEDPYSRGVWVGGEAVFQQLPAASAVEAEGRFARWAWLGGKTVDEIRCETDGPNRRTTGVDMDY